MNILLWIVSAIFYAYEYMIQVSPGVLSGQLMSEMHISSAEFGMSMSLFMYSYTILQMPVGILIDKIGIKKVLTSAILICAIGTTLFGMANGVFMLGIGRFLIGIGSAFAVVGNFCISHHKFSDKYFPVLSGVVLSIGMLGAIQGCVPLSVLCDHVGWRNSMFILAGIGLILSIIMYYIASICYKNNKEDKNVKHIETKSMLLRLIEIKNDMIEVISSKKNWIVATYDGLIYMTFSVFGVIWGTPFLREKYNISITVASSINSMSFIGLAIGSVLFGWLSTVIKPEKVMSLGCYICLVCMLLMIYVNISIFIDYILSFLYGMGIGSTIVGFSYIKLINRGQICGTVLGYMNAMNMIGGAIFQPVVGLLLDLTGKYKIALSILPICIFIGLILSYTLYNNGKNSKQQ